MKTLHMKTFQTITLAAAIALTLACGYSKSNSTPVAGTMPAISELNPNDTTAGGAAFTLTVNGSNFATKAVVNWNGAAQATTYVSPNQLMVAIPAALIADSATIAITVTNPATPGTGIYNTGATLAATSSPMNFVVN
ncbi:MAG TPA: IPT/TIG domain-containing protein [Candidatus Sulfotelmatobacter sp.]|nr:IPT/TIG domain-containing protein [Candidatus Sulfotelmatobacter sp.]